jgi:hypothetical protein
MARIEALGDDGQLSHLRGSTFWDSESSVSPRSAFLWFAQECSRSSALGASSPPRFADLAPRRSVFRIGQAACARSGQSVRASRRRPGVGGAPVPGCAAARSVTPGRRSRPRADRRLGRRHSDRTRRARRATTASAGRGCPRRARLRACQHAHAKGLAVALDDGQALVLD